jgi:hypothetical protein
MSTDFENELRDLFREKAGEAPLARPSLPASAPKQVLRRGRLHQVGTVLGSAAVVVALIVGSVAGLTRILGEGGSDRDIGGGSEVFRRTVTVEAFTVGSPSDWYLVNRWPLSMLIAVEGSGGSSSACVAVPGGTVQECEDTPGAETSSPIPVPYGLPMLQLSNVDLGLGANACEGGLSPDAAVLYVAMDYERSIADGGAGLDPFPPGEPGIPPVGDGPCGPGRYAHFTVNGEPFFTWIGVGTGVSAEDREIVETSYEMMSAIPDWEPSPPNETTPAYVIAGGAYGPGDEWRLELRYQGDSLRLSLEDGPAPQVLVVDESAAPVAWSGADPIFGAVVEGATGVEFLAQEGTETFVALGGSPIPGTIVPVPPTIDAFDLDLFFIDPPGPNGELVGDVAVLGVDAETTPSAPPVGEPREEVVELSGVYEGATWRVAFTGRFDDQSACIEPLIDGDVFGQTCPEPVNSTLASGYPPHLESWSGTFFLRAGSVPIEVVEIRFVSDDDAIVPTDFLCEMGPSGWTGPDVKVCVQLLPTSGYGTIEYVDAAGNVVADEGMAWGTGTAEPEAPTPVNPVHGGTYWAVYPWVGAPGSREADDVSASLLQEFGIEASPGDLACDEGAAEALGTDAEQGIGVYFETEDEANAFAHQAGLLGHEADPAVARVTTYCLD